MSKNNRTTNETYLRCSGCNNITSIQRIKGRARKSGHEKHLWCFRCKDRTKHIEINFKWGLLHDG